MISKFHNGKCVGALQNHKKSLCIKKLRNMIIDWKLLSIYACKFQKKIVKLTH